MFQTINQMNKQGFHLKETYPERTNHQKGHGGPMKSLGTAPLGPVPYRCPIPNNQVAPSNLESEPLPWQVQC